MNSEGNGDEQTFTSLVRALFTTLNAKPGTKLGTDAVNEGHRLQDLVLKFHIDAGRTHTQIHTYSHIQTPQRYDA